MTGAATLASKAASKSGCGLVCAVIPEELNNIFEIKLTVPLNSENGTFKGDDVEKLEEILEKCKCVATGMGAGKSKGYRKILKWVLRNYNGKIVLDADALNIIAERPYYLRGDVIMTPHIGEFSRLCRKSAEEIEKKLQKSMQKRTRLFWCLKAKIQ